MKRIYLLIVIAVIATAELRAQSSHIGDGLASVASIVGETKTTDSPQDTTTVALPTLQTPLWKQKLYYGYYFDIYYHHDSRSAAAKENGYSFTITPEIGWRHKDNLYFGLRFGGSFAYNYLSYSYEALDGTTKTDGLRVMQGSWEATPYVRYRLKTLFNDKVGIWLEGHLYAGMEFPKVIDGNVKGTAYYGLGQTIIYGAQLSPVITYQFNKKSTFQLFFSILSLGYSGTTFCYKDPDTGERYNEFTNDVIIFSGKLRNLIANQFTPGLYGLKIGIQKSF